MDINIAILAGLKLAAVHKELPVQLLVQLIKDQASLGGHQGAVRVGVALISDITDGLALGVHFVHHVDEIQLVIPIIPVTLCHSRIDLFQGAFHNIVHFLNGNALFSKRCRPLLGILADKLNFLTTEFIQDTGCGFIDGRNNLLYMKIFLGPVLFNHIHRGCSSFIITISCILLFFFNQMLSL